MLGNLYIEDQLEQSARKRREAENKEKVLRVTLSQLKRKGLVKDNEHLWALTGKGLRKLTGYRFFRKRQEKTKENKIKRQMIVAFDIPEDKRKSRYWLRIELVSLGFKMLQKSVWLGPAPLPQELIKHLKTIDILSYIKFFEVKESEIV